MNTALLILGLGFISRLNTASGNGKGACGGDIAGKAGHNLRLDAVDDSAQCVNPVGKFLAGVDEPSRGSGASRSNEALESLGVSIGVG